VAAVDRIKRYIDNHRHPAVDSIRRGLDCVLIEYSPDPTFEEWVQSLKDLEMGLGGPLSERATEIVPICYEFGYDLPAISDQTGFSVEEIIVMHSTQEYNIWMIGFMPGFPYMGELPQQLQIRRKTNPDLSIPAGSVAIAEEYVGIYPFESPGGWHVIGRTPLKIFDYSKEIPFTFDYGMKIRFEPITAVEFERRIR
ncbi:MAG: 5-oxoprolinase subunit B family protein, partial [Acidobacteriota bacterium]